MENTEYDYSSAAQRIKDLRHKVIALKGGESVDGLSLLDNIKTPKASSGKQPQKTQEIN